MCLVFLMLMFNYSFLTGFAKQTFIPYKETFGLSFLQGRVVQINTTEKFVVLDNGKVMSDFSLRCYCVLILASIKHCH